MKLLLLILHFFLFFCPVKWAFEMRKGVNNMRLKIKDIAYIGIYTLEDLKWDNPIKFLFFYL
jgi:hypothetical protein